MIGDEGQALERLIDWYCDRLRTYRRMRVVSRPVFGTWFHGSGWRDVARFIRWIPKPVCLVLAIPIILLGGLLWSPDCYYRLWARY